MKQKIKITLKNILLIIFLLFNINAVGQTAENSLVKLADLVNIKLPENAKKITKEEFRASLISTYKDTEAGNGEFYKIGNYSFQFVCSNKKFDSGKANKLKKFMDELFSTSPKGYSSELRYVNNYTAVIIHKVDGYTAWCNGYCFNNALKGGFNIHLDYKTTNEADAEEALNKVLNNISFK